MRRRGYAAAAATGAEASTSSGGGGGNSKAFGHTLSLPRTTFPLYTTEKAQLQLERSLLAEVSDDLYAWQVRVWIPSSPLIPWLPSLNLSLSLVCAWRQAQERRDKSFILHDGPPYANGRLHMGAHTRMHTTHAHAHACACTLV
jgi:hypothetical protein